MKGLVLVVAIIGISLCINSSHAAEGAVVKMGYREYDGKLEIALRHAQQKNYDEAFPVLLQYAKYGDKSAQNLVGAYMVAGLGTKENIAEGLVWLGLALEQKNPTWQQNYEALTTNISASHKTMLEQQTEAFRAKYGIEAQFMTCRQEGREIGSNLRTYRCEKNRDRVGQVRVRLFDQ